MTRAPLNLDKILNQECKSKLANLDADFYGEAAKLIRELEEEKYKAKPGSTKYEFVDEQLRISRVLLKDIISMRTRKIATAASTWDSLHQDIQELDSMTKEERELFDEVVRLIADWKIGHFRFVYNDVGNL